MSDLKVDVIKTTNTNSTLEAQAKQQIAKMSGGELFRNLEGRTSKEEQKAVVDIVKNTDAENIGHLLKGYSNIQEPLAIISPIGGGICTGGSFALVGGTVAGPCGAIVGAILGVGAGVIGNIAINADPIFEQINTEYSFPQKQQVMMDLAKKCHEYLKGQEKPDEKSVYGAVHLEQIIAKGKIDKQDIIYLDNIAKIITDKIKE